MEIFLSAFILIPLVLLGFLGSSVTLFWTLKLVGVTHHRYLQALQVTLLSLGLSLITGLILSLIGVVIPLIPQLLSLLAPFVIYLLLLQKFYHLGLGRSLIVSLLQFILTALILLSLVLSILFPLGLGTAILSAVI